MSRKRAAPASESSNAKRHLNAALAAELQTLRISGDPASSMLPQRNAFGASVASSPFLASSQNSRFAPRYLPRDQIPFRHGYGVNFGTDFVESLSDSSFQPSQEVGLESEPLVVTPGSSSSSTSMAVDDVSIRESVSGTSFPVKLEPSDDDIIVEDIEAPESAENRLVVYHPPVKTSPEALSQLNACLPDGHYVLRNPKTDEWIVKEAHNDRMKRRMALIPWPGDVKKICDAAHRSSRAIPMPWHGSNSTVPVPEPEQTMDIEEIS